MAFLRQQRKGNAVYFYIVQNRRRGGKVQQKILEYLGREPDKKRLKRAMEYWGCNKPKTRRGEPK